MPTMYENTTMGNLAAGSVFRFGHDRRPDDDGMDFVKVTNKYACRHGEPRSDTRPNTNGSEADAAQMKVTYMGHRANILVTKARPF